MCVTGAPVRRENERKSEGLSLRPGVGLWSIGRRMRIREDQEEIAQRKDLCVWKPAKSLAESGDHYVIRDGRSGCSSNRFSALVSQVRHVERQTTDQRTA